jgi:plasmid stabilization system protein ParE
MARVHLTSRALSDIEAIERYSVDRWGKKVANGYLDGLDAALQRLESRPELLRERPDPSLLLRFYAVQRHVLVIDVFGEDIYVLAVWHGRMDVVGRLAELEPQLVYECQLLHARLKSGGR